ncbi:hypothetical protein GCM10012275_32620 [Longimycelium tulufanense]|uniref:Uncharacterized protein n=1 Tax=Longimycelium tulufanense TaxID=907463 RepID=A0A8J3CF14_9PSEU|nr:hypothetical protein GCM10012275_32620 [Longimycelium tulufanense]
MQVDPPAEPVSALRPALGVAVLAALLQTAGPLLGVVNGYEPAFLSWPLLGLLAAAPVVLAGWLAATGRTAMAAGVLAALALFAPGRVLTDLQAGLDPINGARPDLLLPTSLEPVPVAAGMPVLVAGHVAMAVAGVLATRVLPRTTGTARQGLLALALTASVVAATGLALPPFDSDDPYLLPRFVADLPLWPAVGVLLLALAVPVSAALMTGAPDVDAARGGLFGTALATTAVAGPPLVATLLLPDIHPTGGPILALLAAAALAALALAAGRETAEAPGDAGDAGDAGEMALPAASRLHLLAGALALAAGGAAVAGAFLPQLTVMGGLEAPANYAARPLVPAGLLVAALGVALLIRAWAATVRPALAVAWVAVPLAAAGALENALTAVDVDVVDVSVGPGPWAAGLAVVLAVTAGVCAALAGGVERDDVDITALSVDPKVAWTAGVAVVLAAGAFGLPAVAGPDYVSAGLVTQFRTSSWGLLAGLVAVAAACVVAARSRPVRGAALLLGAAALVGVRLLELPLTAGRVAGAGPAGGVWFGIACLVALLAAAAISGARSPRPGV